MRLNFRGRRVLITGGSSGIGLAAAKRLVRDGARVVIAARDASRLERARQGLQAECQQGGTITPVSVDVRNDSSVEGCVRSTIAVLGGLDLLLLSAGEAHAGRFTETFPEVARALMETNYFGAVRATRSALPHLTASRGHISFVSSMAGIAAIYGYTAYGATKFAVSGFAESLRQEVKPMGVGVSVLCPADTDTPQLEAENRTKPAETRAIAGIIKPVSPDAVAAAWLDGISRGHIEIIPGLESKLTALLVRSFPALFRAYAEWRVRKVSR